MNLLNKFWSPQVQIPTRRVTPQPAPRAVPLHAPAAGPRAAAVPSSARFSNGWKEFLWQLDGIGKGQMLDMGSVSQATLNFFIERGFKVYTEDLLSDWRRFAETEAENQRTLAPDQIASLDRSARAAAERFLDANLHYGRNSFDAVLLWDLLDYLDREVAARVVARLTSLVRDGGAVLAIFHTQKAEDFFRYRIVDGLHFELVSATVISPLQRLYQNREIEDLFSRFRTSKAFVGRDHIREAVFVK
jgi:hypothetical protein